MRRFFAVVLSAILLVGIGSAVGAKVAHPAATTSGAVATCTNHPAITYLSDGRQQIHPTCTLPAPPVTPTPTPTPTDTPTPTPTDPPSTTPTDPPTTDPTTPPANGWACTTTAFNDSCPHNGRGWDATPGFQMANGYNTYTANQPVNVGSDAHVTVNANGPDNWQAVAHLPDFPGCGGCVQTYNHSAQYTNDWNGSGWGGSGNQDTPLNALSDLYYTYDETSPQGAGNNYEFAADIWVDEFAGRNGAGSGDIMFWTDTTPDRCQPGGFGTRVIGHWTDPSGANWTVTDFGSYGDEVIFVLDGAGGSGTCARQSSGTMPIKAGLDWMVSQNLIHASDIPATGLHLGNIDVGWEITEANDSTFSLNNFAIHAPLT